MYPSVGIWKTLDAWQNIAQMNLLSWASTPRTITVDHVTYDFGIGLLNRQRDGSVHLMSSGLWGSLLMWISVVISGCIISRGIYQKNCTYVSLRRIREETDTTQNIVNPATQNLPPALNGDFAVQLQALLTQQSEHMALMQQQLAVVQAALDNNRDP